MSFFGDLIEPDNGLTPASEREYRRQYDDTVKRLRAQGPDGRRAAQRYIDDEHCKYRAWREDACARRRREGR